MEFITEMVVGSVHLLQRCLQQQGHEIYDFLCPFTACHHVS